MREQGQLMPKGVQMGTNSDEIGFEGIREALSDGAYLYDKARRTLWHTDSGPDGEDGCAGMVIRAVVIDETEVRERIRSQVPLPVAKDDGVKRLTGDWGVYGDGKQPYYGMTEGERLVRICQMAAGRPDRWVLFDADGKDWASR